MAYFKTACYDDESLYFDVAVTYCPATCGFCTPASEDSLAWSNVPYSIEATPDYVRGALEEVVEGPYNYTDVCAASSTRGSSAPLSTWETVGICGGVLFVVIVVVVMLVNRKKRERKQYDVIS